MKRHISLYYGSINYIAGLNLLFTILTAFFFSRKKLESRLKFIISGYFSKKINVYTFISARSGIAAFLKTLYSNNGEVIISAFTCLAVPTGVISAGLRPVYVDVEPLSLNNNIDNILSKITVNTRAIIVQHTLGFPVDVALLKQKIKGKGIYILEDCALSIGSKFNNKFLGSEGDGAIYSLELSKSLSTGWGGIIVLNNEDLKLKMDLVYSGCKTENILSSFLKAFQTIISSFAYYNLIYNFFGKYILYYGYKLKIFRLSTNANEVEGKLSKDFIQKMGIFQLHFAMYQWKNLKSISYRINKNFKALQEVLIKMEFSYFSHNLDVFVVSPRISFLVENTKFATFFFMQRGIELGTWFDGPLSPLPKNDVFNYRNHDFPNANFISKHIVNLPCHSGVSQNDLECILKGITEFNNHQPESINDIRK
jgi:perosamine synthetase